MRIKTSKRLEQNSQDGKKFSKSFGIYVDLSGVRERRCFVSLSMAAHICVTVSGPALSFLIYENVKSYCDQEGFLVGEVISHVTDTISDSQIRGEKTETIISINSLMPIPHSMSLYNGVGRINQEKLKNFLKDKSKEIIGWYSFRRNSSLVPHLRDRSLHKELSAAVPHVSPEHFTMCLLNTAVSNGGSTHVFNHKFLRYRHSKFEALPMQIHNLGETQPEYKLVPSTTCLSESFNNIITTLKGSQENGSSDATLVCQIQKALQEHLRRLINDVAASEIKVAELEEEVEMLRQHTGPMSNEVLLPQLLRDDTNDKLLELSLSSQNEMPESSAVTADKTIKPSPSSPCSSAKSAVAATSNAHTTNEPFVRLVDLKTQVGQSPITSSVAPEGVSSNPVSKRPTERGRGAGRGTMGRGVRKAQQQKQQGSSSPPPQKSQTPPKGASDNAETVMTRRSGSAGASPVRGRPQNENARGAKRCGYAQAVKRSGPASDSPKPVTRSQASNSQEY